MAVPSITPAESLVWHPVSENELMPDVTLPYVQNQLVKDGVPPQVLMLTGFGETLASGQAGVDVLAAHGVPAAAAWLTYCALPVSEKNLERIAIEAPRELALYLGGGKPMHLFTNSLGCLGVNAAAEAPELFAGVGVQAPYAFAHEAFGRLPLIGTLELTRMASVGVRLGVLTSLQMWHRRKDADVTDVARHAVNELKMLGLSGAATRYALSPEIGRRTVDSFVKLAQNRHPARAFVGRDDKLVRAGEVRAGLRAAALRNGVGPDEAGTYADNLMQTVDGPHTPWCCPEGRDQLTYGAVWLKTLRAPRARRHKKAASAGTPV